MLDCVIELSRVSNSTGDLPPILRIEAEGVNENLDTTTGRYATLSDVRAIRVFARYQPKGEAQSPYLGPRMDRAGAFGSSSRIL